MLPHRVIHSSRISLVTLDRAFIHSSLMGREHLPNPGFHVADEWFAETSIMRMRLAQIEQDPTLEPWLLRAVIRRLDNTMVGHFNCHSAPNPDYLSVYDQNAVELGYSIYPSYRRLGYARETVMAFCAHLQTFQLARAVVLSIEEHNIASQELAELLGFQQVALVEEDGVFERIVLKRFAEPPIPPPQAAMVGRRAQAQS